MFRFVKRLFPDPSKFAPYRRAIRREQDEDEEIVTLDCGHQIILRRHRIDTFPCEECRDKLNDAINNP
jgi:hypothetical protein